MLRPLRDRMNKINRMVSEAVSGLCFVNAITSIPAIHFGNRQSYLTR
jgi:hypothetical protein